MIEINAEANFMASDEAETGKLGLKVEAKKNRFARDRLAPIERASRKSACKTVKVDFGGITMHVKKPTPMQVRSRIAEGEKVLAQLVKILSKPGVQLALSDQHPTYVADKRDPSLVVQRVGKTKRRGHFTADGKFVELESA